MNQDKDQPTKLTVTFADGHTKDFDVFIAVAAEGLLPAGKVDGRTIYAAPEEGFSNYAFTALAADAPVVAGLMTGVTSAIRHMLAAMDIDMKLELLRAVSELGTKETNLFNEVRTIRKDIKEN